MIFSKIALTISLAAVVTADTRDCATFPKEEASLGHHAMLQQSAKPSKGDVLTVIGDAAAPPDSLMPPVVESKSMEEQEMLLTNPLLTDSMSSGNVPTSSMSENVPPQMEEQEVLPTNSVSTNFISSQTAGDALTSSMSESMLPQKTEQEVLLTNPVSMDSISSQTAGDVLKSMSPLPVRPADEQDLFAEACDWRCYLTRYPDLQEQVGVKNFAGAEEHWNSVGRGEGRDCTCAAAAAAAPADAPAISEFMLSVPTNPMSSDSMPSENALTSSISENVAPQMEAQEIPPTNSIATNLISSQTVGDALSVPSCDWQCYLNRYPDLQSTVGTNNVAAAEQHWNSVGQSEGRDCTCAEMESLAATEGAATAEMGSQFKASANVIDAVTSCQPLSVEAQAKMEAEIADYEASEKFQEKILEAQGKSPASAGHVAIMKYLREKVLKAGMSVLELGCGAGGMLRFIEDEYNIGWGGGYYAKAVPHGSLVGVELVPGWVKFAQENFKNISIYQGDVTEYALPEPYANERFDLVMLNDVLEHVEQNRFGCFFSHLDKVTSPGSLVYMHTPSPMAQLEEKQLMSEASTQSNENVVPHHFVVTGMAAAGFELLAFEHDMDTVCGGEGKDLPKQLQGAHCYYNGWPKYTHNVYRKVQDPAVLNLA